MINNKFLVDAGSVASALSPDKQAQIEDIFITHPHIDHIKDICFLVENTFFPERAVINLRATPAILNSVHKHMFNDIIWPDFSKIFVDKEQTKALIKFCPFDKTTSYEGITITSFRVNHPGEAIGYLFDDDSKQVIFSGDTGPTDEMWKVANGCKNLKAIFTEISFPNSMDWLAKASGHYTTAQLISDLEKLENKTVPIFIAHFKPRFFEELMDEYHRLAPPRMQLLHQEDEFEF